MFIAVSYFYNRYNCQKVTIHLVNTTLNLRFDTRIARFKIRHTNDHLIKYCDKLSNKYSILLLNSVYFEERNYMRFHIYTG